MVLFVSKDRGFSPAVLYLFFFDSTWSQKEEMGGEKRQKQIQRRHNVHDKFQL